MVVVNSTFYYDAYFTKQSVLYITLAFSITFLIFMLVLILLSSPHNQHHESGQ